MKSILSIKSNLPLSSSANKVFDALSYLNKKPPRQCLGAGDNAIKFWIGRGDDCQLIIADDKVSHKHCYIEKTPTGTLKLIDNKSKNGTFINNIRIFEKILYVGDIIRISKYEIEFIRPNPSNPAHPSEDRIGGD